MSIIVHMSIYHSVTLLFFIIYFKNCALIAQCFDAIYWIIYGANISDGKTVGPTFAAAAFVSNKAEM